MLLSGSPLPCPSVTGPSLTKGIIGRCEPLLRLPSSLGYALNPSHSNSITTRSEEPDHVAMGRKAYRSAGRGMGSGSCGDGPAEELEGAWALLSMAGGIAGAGRGAAAQSAAGAGADAGAGCFGAAHSVYLEGPHRRGGAGFRHGVPSAGRGPRGGLARAGLGAWP